MMKLSVRAKPGAKTQKVERLDEVRFAVAVKEPAKMGLANRAILKALANFLGMPASRLRIASGHANRQKVIEILKE